MNNSSFNNNILLLKTLFKKWSGDDVDEIFPLPSSGSDRKYFRIKSSKHKALGVYNNNLKENIAFIEFSTFSRQRYLPGLSMNPREILLKPSGSTTPSFLIIKFDVESNTSRTNLSEGDALISAYNMSDVVNSSFSKPF